MMKTQMHYVNHIWWCVLVDREDITSSFLNWLLKYLIELLVSSCYKHDERVTRSFEVVGLNFLR